MTKEKEEAKATVKYIYTKADDFKTIYANGIIGAWTAKREILCDFFLEHLPPIPPEEEYEITADGKVGKLLSKRSSVADLVEREIKISILLKVDDAEVIGNWILDSVKAARIAFGEKK